MEIPLRTLLFCVPHVLHLACEMFCWRIEFVSIEYSCIDYEPNSVSRASESRLLGFLRIFSCVSFWSSPTFVWRKFRGTTFWILLAWSIDYSKLFENFGSRPAISSADSPTSFLEGWACMSSSLCDLRNHRSLLSEPQGIFVKMQSHVISPRRSDWTLSWSPITPTVFVSNFSFEQSVIAHDF